MTFGKVISENTDQIDIVIENYTFPSVSRLSPYKVSVYVMNPILSLFTFQRFQKS